MSDEDMTTIINELRAIRTRRREEVELRKRMNDLILEAKEKGFTFIDNTCGFVREVNDFNLYDERA